MLLSSLRVSSAISARTQHTDSDGQTTTAAPGGNGHLGDDCGKQPEPQLSTRCWTLADSAERVREFVSLSRKSRLPSISNPSGEHARASYRVARDE